MERAIVTVERRDEALGRDLEVPTGIEAGQLARLVARALYWEADSAGQPIEYEIWAEPPGRLLQSDESLADVGAWEGARLVLQRVGDVSGLSPGPDHACPSQEDPTSDFPVADQDGPVRRWRPLGVELPTGLVPGQGDASLNQPGEGTGFAWKQVD